MVSGELVVSGDTSVVDGECFVICGGFSVTSGCVDATK